MESATRQRSEPARPRRTNRLVFAGRAARKVAMTALGISIAVVGVVLLPLPGPGMLVIGLGLGVLSTEYRWPGRLLRWLRQEAQRHLAQARERRRARGRGAGRR